jgi:hypothetical protein
MLDFRYALYDLEYQIERRHPTPVREHNEAPVPRPSRSEVLLAAAVGVSIVLAVAGLLLAAPGVVVIFATFAIAFGAIRIDRKAQWILNPKEPSR